MSVNQTPVFILILLLVSGCSSIPDTSLTYYLPKAESQFVVKRQLICDSNNELKNVVDTVVKSDILYVADHTKNYTFSSKMLSPKIFGEAKFSFSLTEDQRLAGVSASQTSHVATVIEGATKLIGTFAGFAMLDFDAVGKEICKNVETHGDSVEDSKGTVIGNTVSVTYSIKPEFTKDTMLENLTLDEAYSDQGFTQCSIDKLAGELHISIKAATVNLPAGKEIDDTKALIKIKDEVVARQPSFAVITIKNSKAKTGKADKNKDCKTKKIKNGKIEHILWTGNTQIPQLGKLYEIPLPTAGLFGSSGFEVAFHPSGALQKLSYDYSSGAADSIGALNSLVGLPYQLDQAELNRLKTEADIIAQEQRLAACKLKPSDCK